MAGSFRYAIIGCGMQGTAEAYDLAMFGDAEKIYMADYKKSAAKEAAARINRLTGRDLAIGIQLDARDTTNVVNLMKEVDTCCSAAHYAFNLDLTRNAIIAKCNFCDLGGNTDVVKRQHELSKDAEARGVCIIPDCGLAPGLGNILAARAIEKMNCDSIQIRCGGLPQIPKPPLGYRIVFSVAGLTNEYTGQCVEIRNNEIVSVEAFSEPEPIEFPPPAGTCEAFLTSGGTSTGPWSFLGKVKNYGYKTVRYPGHFEKMRSIIDLGFLDLEPVRVRRSEVVPRELFHVLASKHMAFPEDRDLVVLRVKAEGHDFEGHPQTMIQDMIDFFDDDTGFSAMERTTAFAATVIAIMMTQKKVPPGVRPLETSVNGDFVIEELARRKIIINTSIDRRFI